LRRGLDYPFYTYSIFGLQLKTNRPLPTPLKTSKKNSAPDLGVWLGAKPIWLEKKLDQSRKLFYESDCLDYNGDPTLKIWELKNGSYFWLCYNDGTNFLVNRRGTKIWGTRSDDTTLEDTMTYLVGPVLGFVLRLRGIPCLHASAVVIKDQAAAFLGSAEAGKSTIAAAFATQGYPVITEDIVTLCCRDHKFLVQPGYPYVSLWPDSVKMLYGISDALPRLTPASGINAKWDKRYLDLTQEKYQVPKKPLPLGAVYILEGFNHKPKTPKIKKLSKLEGLMKLISNTYVRCSLDCALRAQEFKLLTQLSKAIPIRKVHSSPGSRNLINVCKEIVKDFEKIVPLNAKGRG